MRRLFSQIQSSTMFHYASLIKSNLILSSASLPTLFHLTKQLSPHRLTTTFLSSPPPLPLSSSLPDFTSPKTEVVPFSPPQTPPLLFLSTTFLSLSPIFENSFSLSESRFRLRIRIRLGLVARVRG